MAAAFTNMARSINVWGLPLEMASTAGQPTTGFFRDGYCNTGPADMGKHTVAGVVSDEFLDFSASQGNDLRGVAKPGCTWCLCVSRWFEAFKMSERLGDKIVPRVKLDATHENTLSSVSIEDLKKFDAAGQASSNVGRDDGAL